MADANPARMEVFTELKDALGEVIGVDTVSLLQITDKTRFFADLELGSIEVVQLVERMGQRFPLGEDFLAWLSEKSLIALARLQVGEVVDYITDASN
jgi:acyl carrier protein